MLMFEEQDYLMKFDLKSGYHHLDIFREHQTYLGFSWVMGKETKYFVQYLQFYLLGWLQLVMSLPNC